MDKPKHATAIPPSRFGTGEETQALAFPPDSPNIVVVKVHHGAQDASQIDDGWTRDGEDVLWTGNGLRRNQHGKIVSVYTPYTLKLAIDLLRPMTSQEQAGFRARKIGSLSTAEHEQTRLL